MPQVLHVKHGHEGGIRILTEEPVGRVVSHSHVRITTPLGDVSMHLAGQREFIVPAGSSVLHFEDGSSYDIPEDE